MKKLKLNKETISILGNENQKNINGGEQHFTLEQCTNFTFQGPCFTKNHDNFCQANYSKIKSCESFRVC